MTWNITLRMRRWRKVSDFACQKFRLTPGSSSTKNVLIIYVHKTLHPWTGRQLLVRVTRIWNYVRCLSLPVHTNIPDFLYCIETIY